MKDTVADQKKRFQKGIDFKECFNNYYKPPQLLI